MQVIKELQCDPDYFTIKSVSDYGCSDTSSQAKMHGNEPSKGARIDAELQQEEEEELRRKGKLN